MFALAALLSVASASLAGDLATPPMYVGTSTNVWCLLTNLTSAPLPAQLQMIGEGGFVLTDTGPITVDPYTTVNTYVENPIDFVHCRFVNASKSKVRADLATSDFTSDGSFHLIVPAQ
jgi:hypothetical protein